MTISSATAAEGRSPRRGMVLSTVLVLVVLASIFVFAFFGYFRESYSSAHHTRAREVAFELAQAGVSAGVQWFRNTVEPCALHRAALTRDAAAVSGMAELLPVDRHPALQRLLGDAGWSADLTVELTLLDVRSLRPTAPSTAGVRYSSREKVGTLRVRSMASYQGAHRCLASYRTVRVVATTPYVVSKFTAFARTLEPDGRDKDLENHLNRLPVQYVSTTEGRRQGADLGVLTLLHGAAPALEDRGFVFLGLDRRLVLNVTHGGGRHGEAHLLLRGPYELTSRSPRAQLPGYTLRLLQSGFFTGVHDQSDAFDLLPFDAPPRDPLTELGSSFHLLGSEESPSPTAVLMNALRRYLVFRWVVRDADGLSVVLPFATQDRWFSPPDPWPAPPEPFDPRYEAFREDYARYMLCMSSLVEEPYNRSVDVAAAPSAGMVVPRALEALTRIRPLDEAPAWLYRPERAMSSVRLLTDGATELFAGDLRALGSAELNVPDRAVVTAPASACRGFLASRPRRIPGIIHFAGEGGIVLDAPLDLVEGGLVAADGPIVLAAGIRCGGRPLCLVSLRGDVVVRTAAPLRASLVALEGTVRYEGSGPLALHGNVVAGRLSPAHLLADGRDVTVTYDEALDPTRRNGEGSFGVFLSPEPLTVQER